MVKSIGAGLGVCLLFFILIEGVCSMGVAVYNIASQGVSTRGLANPHLRYDADLGWVSVPDYNDPNYYATGIALRTNSKGFRDSEQLTAQVPAGRFRVICNGDSQTFGAGVSNSQTWCEKMEAFDPRFQAVNISEVGYGADQMYLKYKRDAASLQQDVHLFAIVTDDLLRMQHGSVNGYSRPVLKVSGGELVAEKAGPPEPSIVHILMLKPNPLRQFRSVEVAADSIDRLHSGRPAYPAPAAQDKELLDKMIDSLLAMQKKTGSILAFVYIPTRLLDYTPGVSDTWREMVRQECASRGVPDIDLIPDFRKLPVNTRDGLVFWAGAEQNFRESIGHFSVQGHEYFGKEIYNKLTAIPAVAARLAKLPASAPVNESAAAGVAQVVRR